MSDPKTGAPQAWSFFWEWDLTVSLVRWMTSFATTDEDHARFIAGVCATVADHVKGDHL